MELIVVAALSIPVGMYCIDLGGNIWNVVARCIAIAFSVSTACVYGIVDGRGSYDPFDTIVVVVFATYINFFLFIGAFVKALIVGMKLI
jgi:hypothetical protein